MEVSWGRAGEVSARHSMAAAPGVEVIGASQDLVCGAWKPPRQCTKTETVWACPNESACRDLFGGSPFPLADATPLPSPPKFPTMKRNADNEHPMPSLEATGNKQTLHDEDIRGSACATTDMHQGFRYQLPTSPHFMDPWYEKSLPTSTGGTQSRFPQDQTATVI